MRWKTGPVQQLLLLEAPPSPLSSRPEKSWAKGPPKAMKNGSCSATTVSGSAALPFVISTGAPKERSGEICGVSGPFLEMFFDRAQGNGETCGALAASSLTRSPRSQQLSPLAQDLSVCCRRHRQHVSGAFRQPVIGPATPRFQQFLQLSAAEYPPMFDRYPVGARQVGSRKHAIRFQQLCISFRPGSKGKYPPVVLIQIGHGKHLAAERLISHPIDQVGAPLHG